MVIKSDKEFVEYDFDLFFYYIAVVGVELISRVILSYIGLLFTDYGFVGLNNITWIYMQPNVYLKIVLFYHEFFLKLNRTVCVPMNIFKVLYECYVVEYSTYTKLVYLIKNT